MNYTMYLALLKKHRPYFVKDLRGDVYETLVESQILNNREIQEINILNSQEEKNGKLLDILLKKDQSAREIFIEALKDWYPWLMKHLMDIPLENGKEERKTPRELYNDAINDACIPPLPIRNITRQETLAPLLAKLRVLERGQYVVLHGMPGCGKSCLASEALHDYSLLINTFKGKVWWLSVGCEDSDDIWALQAELLERLPGKSEELPRETNRALAQLHKREATEVSFNTELRQLASKFVQNALHGKADLTNIDLSAYCIIIDILQTYHKFQMDDVCDGLLILDDVTSEKVINALRVGCRILVTTKEMDVMHSRESRTNFIKVEEGFTESESLSLLAISVGVTSNELPPQAKDIHKHSKGFPMTMSLIGAQLEGHKEEVLLDPTRWNYYVEVLKEKQYRNIMHDSLTSTIELCVKNLLPEIRRQHYQDFAVFVEDVNIKPEVLCTLWGKHKSEVQDIMFELERKSLVVRKWNVHLKSFVYGIHDLLLSYLQEQLDAQQTQALHAKLLDCYGAQCGGDYSQLTRDDNYIFYYLGYHLRRAGRNHLFPSLYLNLEFVEAKLKSVGSLDLLNDYKKYRNDITVGAVKNVSKLRDYEWFVEWAGESVRQSEHIDIVQFAMQEAPGSQVYMDAKALARKRAPRPYVQLLLDPPESRLAPQTLHLNEEITSCCFTDYEYNIVVGYQSGAIKIWYLKLAQLWKSFCGHKDAVTQLSLNHDGTHFLSASRDGNISVWPLSLEDSAQTVNVTGERTPSPRLRQSSYSELWPCSGGEMESVTPATVVLAGHKGPICWAAFSPCADRIVSTGADKTVKVWSVGDGVCHLTLDSILSEPTSCAFSGDGRLVFVSYKDCSLQGYNALTGCRQTHFPTSPHPVRALLTIPGGDTELVVLTERLLSLWKGGEGTTPHQPDRLLPLCDQYPWQQYEKFHCVAASNHIAVSSSDHKVVLFHPDTGNIIREFYEPSGLVRYLDTRWLASESHQLIVGCYDDNVVRLWKMRIAPGQFTTTLRPTFTAAWPLDSLPLVVAPSNQRTVEIMQGRSVCQSITVSGDAEECRLSGDGKTLVYMVGTTVYLHSFAGNSQPHKIAEARPPVLLRIFDMTSGDGQPVVLIASLDIRLRLWRNSRLVWGKGCGPSRLLDAFLLQDEQQILTISFDGSMKLWSTGEARLMQIVSEGRLDVTLRCCAYAPAQRHAAMLLKGFSALYSAEIPLSYTATNYAAVIQAHQLPAIPTALAFSPDGAILVVGLDNATVLVMAGGTVLWTALPPGSADPILDVCPGPAGRVIAALTRKCLYLCTQHAGVTSVQLSCQRISADPHESRFATVDSRGTVHLVKLLDEEEEPDSSEETEEEDSSSAFGDSSSESRPNLKLDLSSAL